MLEIYKHNSKYYLSSLTLMIGLSSLGYTASSYAEVLQMPTTPKSFSVTLPGRGMSMTEVLENFGEPTSKEAEVGEPPITRWNYPNYNVIFEYQYVIHSLSTNKPMGLIQEPPMAESKNKENSALEMHQNNDMPENKTQENKQQEKMQTESSNPEAPMPHGNMQ